MVETRENKADREQADENYHAQDQDRRDIRA
jgi:hypothetical protein